MGATTSQIGHSNGAPGRQRAVGGSVIVHATTRKALLAPEAGEPEGARSDTGPESSSTLTRSALGSVGCLLADTCRRTECGGRCMTGSQDRMTGGGLRGVVGGGDGGWPPCPWRLTVDRCFRRRRRRK